MNANVLVIDDDPDILDAITFVLEDSGYTVEATKRGEVVEHLSEVSGSLPKLIILDVLLSGKDGRNICRKLKSDKKTKNVPIIMISAHPNVEDSVKEAGANDFLAKPFDVDALLEKVSLYTHN